MKRTLLLLLILPNILLAISLIYRFSISKSLTFVLSMIALTRFLHDMYAN